MTLAMESRSVPPGSPTAQPVDDQPSQAVQFERPTRPPHVELIGELQGSGFADSQWLIQRDGQFLQVTELLYRIVEHADGTRTLEEIAAALTATTNWIVTPEQARHLIQTKLVPLGLIATRRAEASGMRGVTEDPAALLGFTVRAKVLGPRLIDPITRVLQVLYAPAILVPVLVAIAVGHGWLYLRHGVGEGLREVLYTPGLLPIVVAIVIVAAVVHEFGHAAALRYGGGKVRGIGVGLYFIYPGFFTDVTDSYRLGRGARVRTDLGGFYFSLIFAAGIIALSFVSGQEFLLLVVLLINLDIVRQTIPFFRLDGYWALADLTGIPDLYSMMGPFLRSVLPIPGRRRRLLPRMKPWVTMVFVAYMIVTIPLLALLLILLLRSAPHLFATLRDAFLAQTDAFATAQRNGDRLSSLAAAMQAAMLALEIVGLGFFLVKLLWSSVKGGWRLTHRTAAGSVPV